MGMNAGVSTRPCDNVITPRRPSPSVASTSNFKLVLPLDQHRIAIAEEAVAVLDRMTVRDADILCAAERRYQHEQRRFREMEIGEQALDHPEPVARQDEKTGL